MTREEFLKIESVMGKDKICYIFERELIKYDHIVCGDAIYYSTLTKFILLGTIIDDLEHTVARMRFGDCSDVTSQVFNIIKQEYRKFKIDTLNL